MSTGQSLAGKRFKIKEFVRQSKQIGRQRVFLTIWDDPLHGGHGSGRGDIQGCPAAGDDDILHPIPIRPADGGARIRCGFCGNRAGVDNCNIRPVSRRDNLMTGFAELAGE